ncbi:MAG: hypothetical protein C0501_18975 [Isosphaera sp.]|nr:hypothetical protein [Isosphaera sp.]
MNLLQLIQRLGAGEELPDAPLLAAFAERGDEAAFAALMRRHGPLVWGVCRRVVGDTHAAEDAFQASFLILARKARSVRSESSLAGWLARVAHRVALAARAAGATRRLLEVSMAEVPDRPAPPAPAADLRAALEHELHQLPAKYHTPLVLCFLEGKTQDEAARELGWPAGTVRTRVARGLEMLRRRAARRGYTLAAAAVAPALAEGAAAATVPPALLAATARAVALQVAGAPVAAAAGASVARLVAAATPPAVGVKVALGVAAAALLAAGGVLSVVLAGGGQRPVPPDPPPGASLTPATPAPVGPTARTPGLTPRSAWVGPRTRVQAVAFLAGDRVVTAGGDGGLVFWDRAAGARQAVVNEGRNLTCLAVSPDGRTLAVGGDRDNVRLRDATTGADLGRLHPEPFNVLEVAFSADGKRVAAAADYKGRLCLKAWDVGTGDEVRLADAGDVRFACLAPDGRTLATACRDTAVVLRDPATGAERLKLPRHGSGEAARLAAVGFAADGRALVTAGQDNVFRVWDCDTGRERLSFRGHTRPEVRLAFSPDRRTLATGNGDGTVKLWDLTTGAELSTAAADPKGVTALAFSPDGAVLIAGGADGVLRLWDVTAN